MFKNIMLAIDGSAYTDGVLAYGIELARHFESHLTVLTVADVRIFEWASAVGSDGFISIVPSGSYQDASRNLLEEKCDKILARCSELLRESQIAFTAEKSVGAPVDVILERAQVADLLLMGKRGEFARWEKKALGVTVESVSRLVRRPLMIVRQEFVPIRKILVGYDGSDHANRALQLAAHIAEKSEGEIHVACCQDDRELASHYCDTAMGYLKSYRTTASAQAYSGHPDEALVRLTHDHEFELIAIGAYGHSRIREALLGSTTVHIMRHAACPVLLAK